jgi:hypothetical protein
MSKTAQSTENFPAVENVAGIIDIFHEFIDSIYWPGKAAEMADHEPEAYTFHLTEFLNA